MACPIATRKKLHRCSFFCAYLSRVRLRVSVSTSAGRRCPLSCGRPPRAANSISASSALQGHEQLQVAQLVFAQGLPSGMKGLGQRGQWAVRRGAQQRVGVAVIDEQAQRRRAVSVEEVPGGVRLRWE